MYIVSGVYVLEHWGNADFTVLAAQQVRVGAACNAEFRKCDSGAHASWRSGGVTPQRGGGWREGVGPGIYPRAAFPRSREAGELLFFNSKKFLNADPRATDASPSSSTSTCQQLSCLTGPSLGMLTSGYQTTVNAEQNQTTHQITKTPANNLICKWGCWPTTCTLLLLFLFK